MTSDGTNTYTWDARNRLVGITGAVSASFSYDALGRRTSKTINGVTTSFLYDGNDIVAEMQGGAITAFYLRSLNIDEPFIRTSSSGNEYYHADALGSALALTNDAGAVTTSYAYEPFGRTQITGTSTNPFQYTGRENDGTGLYYYRARYYSPAMHRFIREDLVRDTLDNLFLYVLNNPLRFTDPLGLELVDVCSSSGCYTTNLSSNAAAALVPASQGPPSFNTQNAIAGGVAGAAVGGLTCGPDCALAGGVGGAVAGGFGTGPISKVVSGAAGGAITGAPAGHPGMVGGAIGGAVAGALDAKGPAASTAAGTATGTLTGAIQAKLARASVRMGAAVGGLGGAIGGIIGGILGERK
jgi:RHS repeat-associated protein